MHTEQTAERTANPYAVALNGLDPVHVMSSTAERLEAFACSLAPEQLDTPRAPGKWSWRELLAHLADCELAFSFRLRQTLAGSPGGTPAILQPFDQDAWAEHYAAYTIPAALALFRAAREWNLALLKTVSQSDSTKPAEHPERGKLTSRPSSRPSRDTTGTISSNSTNSQSLNPIQGH